MKIKRIVLISLGLLVLLALALVAPTAWLFTSGFRRPVVAPAPEYWPTGEWQARSPEEMGFDSAKLAEMVLALQENNSAIDSLMIIHDGYVVLDAHFAPYDGTFPHDMASVTKSVTTTLIAIAAHQGLLDLDQPVVSFFPERTIANLDERKARLTVRHLTAMTSGMEVDCEDDEATLDVMRATPDWVQAALDRPMVSEPGSEYCYDSPGMHLLSAILEKASGKTELAFAEENLFAPLGIREAIWETDPQGYTHGWGDLHLRPEDAAKIGYLWLHRGSWDGQQIVPEAWVLDSVKAQSRWVGDDYGYGYGWWVSPVGYYATGRGGQNVRVFASLNTLVVTTGGGFDFPEVEPFLTPLLLKIKDSRPANPEGEAALEEALAAIQEESNLAVAPSAALAGDISGVTYLCESNLVGIESLRFDFSDPTEARLHFQRGYTSLDWSVGLDGQFRFAPDGAALRGGWEDEQTFVFEIFDIGFLERRIRYTGDSLQLELPELELSIACQVAAP